MLTDNDWECISGTSSGSDHSDMDLKFCLSASDSFGGYERIQECSSSDEEEFAQISGKLRRKPHTSKSLGLGHNYKFDNVSKQYRLGLDLEKESTPVEKASGKKGEVINALRRIPRASLSFWPEWVYQMHDSYALARRAAGSMIIQ